jgi:dihydroflavonol-4-reductase
VRVLARSRTKGKWIERLGAEVVLGDVRDAGPVRAVAAGCNVVFHLATHRLEEDARWRSFREVNIVGTENVMAAADAGGCRVVYSSSVNVYGRLSAEPANEETPTRPTLYHDRSKLDAERVVVERGRERGVPVVVARLPSVLGPGQPRFRKTFREAAAGKPYRFFGPQDPWRNIVHVSDVVDGLKRCAVVAVNDPGLYLLPGHNTSLGEFLRLIADEAGAPFQMRRMPLWPLKWMALAYRLALAPFGREPTVARGIEYFVRNHRFDGAKARWELGYEPKVSLRETIRSTLAWYRETNYADSSDPLLAQMAETR